jgi:hypothetical protein
MHLLLKSDKPLRHITNTEIARIWGHGFTKKKLLEAENVGTYFVSYFTDLIVDEYGRELSEQEIEYLDGKEMSKRRKKGSRLRFYPPYFKFYRCSKGIQKPEVRQVSYAELVEMYGEPTYKEQILVKKVYDDGAEEILNVITNLSFEKRDETEKDPKTTEL